MPAAWEEFTARELGAVLAVSRWNADAMLGLAHDLEVNLPGTRAAFLDGIVNAGKAEIIARATAVLNPGESRAAEALVLGRAGRLTPAGLRSAIARAVIEVAPQKARERRKKAEADARVERWAEASGNAGLAGRELPPAEVLAADQKITSRARQLKQAGLAGSMDELRARAYMDLLLGTDSRPRQDGPGQGAPGQDGPGQDGPGPGGSGLDRPAAGNTAGDRRAAGRVRRAGQPDHLAGHPARPGRAARGDPRPGPHRPESWSKYTRSLPSSNPRRFLNPRQAGQPAPLRRTTRWRRRPRASLPILAG